MKHSCRIAIRVQCLIVALYFVEVLQGILGKYHELWKRSHQIRRITLFRTKI